MRLRELRKGDTERTARKAAVMNEIIKAVNNLLNVTFIPEGSAKMTSAEANVVVDISGAIRMAREGLAEEAAAAVNPRPFEIINLNGTSSPAIVGVASYSPISVGLTNMTSSATVSGLLIEHIAEDVNAFEVPAIGECIYLEMNITGGATLSSVTVEHGAVWSGFPNPIEITGGVQTKYRLLLAEFTNYDSVDETRPALFYVSSGESVIQCTQMWSRGIVMIKAVVDGTLCLVPMDASLDYPITLEA